MASDLIPLSKTELASLMRASEGREMPCAFGTGGVALHSSRAPWAVSMLREWRGLTFSDGAGI